MARGLGVDPSPPDRVGDERVPERGKDPEVVVCGDPADDRGDHKSLPVASQHAGLDDDQEQRGEQLRCDHERQQVVHGVVLVLGEGVG